MPDFCQLRVGWLSRTDRICMWKVCFVLPWFSHCRDRFIQLVMCVIVEVEFLGDQFLKNFKFVPQVHSQKHNHTYSHVLLPLRSNESIYSQPNSPLEISHSSCRTSKSLTLFSAYHQLTISTKAANGRVRRGEAVPVRLRHWWRATASCSRTV